MAKRRNISKYVGCDLTECSELDIIWFTTSLPGGHSVLVPPDPISNSEVKRLSADDSVGSPHVKVGHCQAFIQSPESPSGSGLFYLGFCKAIDL